MPLTFAPDPDQKECRNQRQFVKGIEEKQILGGKRAGRSRCNEQHAGVEKVLPLLDGRRNPDCGQRDDPREKQHHHAEAVSAQKVFQIPFRSNCRGVNMLKPALRFVVAHKSHERGEKVGRPGKECALARRRAKNDRHRGKKWNENEQIEHHLTNTRK